MRRGLLGLLAAAPALPLAARLLPSVAEEPAVLEGVVGTGAVGRSGALAVGDIWFDGNWIARVWTGSSWVLAQDGVDAGLPGD